MSRLDRKVFRENFEFELIRERGRPPAGSLEIREEGGRQSSKFEIQNWKGEGTYSTLLKKYEAEGEKLPDNCEEFRILRQLQEFEIA